MLPIMARRMPAANNALCNARLFRVSYPMNSVAMTLDCRLRIPLNASSTPTVLLGRWIRLPTGRPGTAIWLEHFGLQHWGSAA
jgi:hypothetical protein